MKCRIRKIRAHTPGHLGPAGEVLTWRPMVLELLVEAPKDQAEAAAQLKEAESWAYPRVRGKLRTPPPALDLSPFTSWPSCSECGTEVRLTKIADGSFLAECHLCGGGSGGDSPSAALEEFARELGE